MTATQKAPPLAADECRFLIQPIEGAAVVQIGPKAVYLVRESVGRGGERVWHFTTTQGRAWTVHVRGPETMHCTCPDQMFRRRSCKHRRAIETLYGVPQAIVPPGGWY